LPIHLVQWPSYHSLGAIRGAALLFLWVLLRDIALPGLGFAIGGVISERAFSDTARNFSKREIA
jgi:hypothetical protein